MKKLKLINKRNKMLGKEDKSKISRETFDGS